MKIFGKTLSEYVHFEKGFLVLVLVVGVARFGLPLVVPTTVVKFLSLSVLLLLGAIYYSVRVHTSGFGSYMQLLPVLALPVFFANLIIIWGIVLAIVTGTDNIFSVPEYSGGADGKTWGHVGGHAILMVVGPAFLWGLGSLIMLVTKKLTGGQPETGATSA
jgi:hypothetical protein